MTMTTDPEQVEEPLTDHENAVAYAEGPPEVQAAAVAELEREPVDAAMEKWRSGEDLEQRRERLPESDAWDRMAAMASKLAKAPTMPKHIRESRDPEADMMVILLTAHDLGLSATVALQKVNVIEGKPAMAAELMRMLVRRDGHQLWCEIEKGPAGDALSVTWFGIRKDSPDRTHEATFSVADAVTAGLCTLDKDGEIHARSSSGKRLPWEAYTEDMLSARATSRLCRRVFEDCLAGVSYTPEELGTITVEPLDAPAPVDPEVPEADLAAYRARIDAMTDDQQALVKAKWAERKIYSLRPGGRMPTLRESERAAVEAVLAEAVREAVDDAVVVPPEIAPHAFEGSESADECATCGRGREDALHAAVGGERPPDPPAEPQNPQEPPSEPVAPLSDEELTREAEEARLALEGRITAEVAALTTVELTDALGAAALSVAGDPKMRRARLVDWRYGQAMTADVI